MAGMKSITDDLKTMKTGYDVQRSDANKLQQKLTTTEASLASLADRVHHLEQQFLRQGAIVTLADTRDRLEVVEARSLDSGKVVRDVGRAFGTLKRNSRKTANC